MSQNGQLNRENLRWIIVGAGGFGREVWTWSLGQLPGICSREQVHFLDDDPDCLEGYPDLQPQWLGPIKGFVPTTNDRFLMAIGDPQIKLRLGRRLVAQGARFETFVHPSAIIAAGSQLGMGCVLCPQTVVSCHVRLGAFVMMDVGALVGHDSTVEDGCTFLPQSSISGNVTVGEGVLLGSQSCVLPGLQVGDAAKIGAGSVVVHHVKPGASMMGIPATPLEWTKRIKPVGELKAA